jgi:hypothetical protein
VRDRTNSERICVVYFENKEGYVIVAPDRSHPTPQGFIRRECHHLHEVDRLTRKLQTQDRNMFSRLMEKDRKQIQAKHEQIKSKLRQRLLAVDCSRVERLFILGAFQYLDKKERELLKCEVGGYFHAREFDSTNKYGGTEDHGRQLEKVVPKMSDRLAAALSK